MKILYRIASVLLYTVAFLGVSAYFFLSFFGSTELTTSGKLCLLGFICISLYFGAFLITKYMGKNTTKKIMKGTFIVFFVLYIFLLTGLVLFDLSFGRTGFSHLTNWNFELLSSYLQCSFNVIPFKTVFEYICGAMNFSVPLRTVVINLLGNIVAFMPFALFLPLLFDKLKSFKSFFIIMVCLVCIVELAQLISLSGSCDIDDLILNVGGACFAYFILHKDIFKKAIEKVTKLSY